MSFIFYVPPYNECSGGTRVLYLTALEMSKQGVKIALWQNGRPIVSDYFKIKKWYFIASWFLKVRFRYKEPPFGLKYAKHKDLNNSKIIYYELVDGNPLAAKKIIRWILYFPFRLHGIVKYGENEKFYTFLLEYVHKTKWEHRSKLFNVVFPIRDEYLKYKDLDDWKSRTSTCFMLRKAKKDKKWNNHDNHFKVPSDSILIDGLSHDQTSLIFSKSKYFYCYDLYTAYAEYAAVCGCIPILIPPKNLTISEWKKDRRERLGVAFGEQNIQWAYNTRSLMLEYINKKVKKTIFIITDFIKENG
jgi:hypothetical protein